MADTLKFGPEWLRALSDGNSVTSPPPSPAGIPKYKLAENRYGREEMLALYVPNTKLPESLREFPAVVHEKALQPLALIPLSEDEQRLMSQSVNSTAVLRLMGRGGGPMLRGGRGGGDRGRGRGRGRGEGGFFQRTASFDEEGFGRGRTHGRGEAWEENDKRFERGGFGRAYEDAPTSPRREYSRSMSSDNWRDLKARGAEEEEPEGDWRRAGPRDKWSRASWREARDRGYDYHYDDYHKSPREFEDRPYGRSRNSGSWEEEDGLPDWAKDGAEDEDIGTFDASGAFMTLKDAAELEEREKKGDRNDTEKKDEEEESNKPNGAQKEKESKDPSKLDPKRTEKRDKSKSSSPKPQRAQDSDRESVSSSRSEKSDKSSSSKRSKSNEEVDSKPNNIDQKVEEVAENILRENHVTVEPVKEASPPEEPTPPSEQMESHEEVQFDHLEKAAEHLVATWTAEEDAKSDNKAKVESGSVPQDHEDANSWFYRDPQGDLQGPFSSTEMREWFSAGYFTMTLLVKRGCDESFHPLGELIKRWGRVPFLPGPTPPPLQNTGTSSPHQQMAPPVQPGIVQHPQPQGSPQPAGSPELMAAGATGASGQVDHLKLQQMLLQQQMFFRQLQMQQMIAMLQQQEGFNKLSPQQQQAMIYQALAQQPPPTPQQLMKLPPMPATSTPQPASAPQQQPPSLSPREGEQPGGQGHPAFHRSMSTPNGAAMPSFHRSMSQPGGLDDPAAMWAGQGPPPPVTSGGWTQGTSVWDIETPKQPPSLEDIQRQDLERQHREQEQREAEERRRQEEELQRQKEEEERRQREEEERRKVEMERQKEMERQRIADQIRREQEEARRREEEERRKEEERRRQEEDRRRQDEEERKRREIEEMERKRAEEIMRRQKAEEMRRHQQEALRRMQQEQMANMQLPASAQWGTMNNQLPSSSSGPSLAEIQQLEAEQQRKEQEEHQRRMEMQRHLVALQQQQQQQAKSWTQQKAAAQPSGPMSLRDIQQEQARQLERERQKQQNTPKPHKPASVPLATAAVWTGASQASNWAAEGAWGRAAQGQGFWEDAMVISNKKMPAVNNNAGFPALSTPNNSNVNTNKNNKAAKSKKDEESVQRLFRATKPKDDFTVWCEKALCGMHTSVDIPTFIAFLQDVESPYEVHDYVRSYLGETKEATEFAKQFLERRSKYKNQLKQQDQEEEIMWGPAPAINPNNNKAYSNCVEDPESAASKQLKKKKKMQKLDASILGFTVHAAPDRVNIGQIESAPFE